MNEGWQDAGDAPRAVPSATTMRRRAVLALTAAWAATAAAGAVAQTAAPANAPFTPFSGQAGKDVVWVPTPDDAVNRMLQLAEVQAADRVVDLGSGDGKIVIAAVRNHGARARGLEYNPEMVALSRRLAQQAGVTEKASFQQADIFVTDFSEATVVTMYLLPQLNLKLRPKLFTMAPGTRVVSHSFDMGDWQPDEQSRAGVNRLYRWTIPANASGTWAVSSPRLAQAVPQTISLRQRYQKVDGEAQFAGLSHDVARPHLHGDRLSFTLRDASGAVLHFDGQVTGDRISGTVARGREAPVPFEAKRTDGKTAIDGSDGTKTSWAEPDGAPPRRAAVHLTTAVSGG